MPYTCKLGNKKPEVCKLFPRREGEVKEFPSCSFYWVRNWLGKIVRKGKCNQCGECCLRPYLYLPKFSKKFTEEPCPYLEYVDGL